MFVDLLVGVAGGRGPGLGGGNYSIPRSSRGSVVGVGGVQGLGGCLVRGADPGEGRSVRAAA